MLLLASRLIDLIILFASNCFSTRLNLIVHSNNFILRKNFIANAQIVIKKSLQFD